MLLNITNKSDQVVNQSRKYSNILNESDDTVKVGNKLKTESFNSDKFASKNMSQSSKRIHVNKEKL